MAPERGDVKPPGRRRVTVDVGAGAGSWHESSAPPDVVLTIGAQHPSGHGALRLRLTLDGERIVACEPVVGFLHRGVEKLFEVRDYRQVIVLANRHDWLSAFSSELGVVLAVEQMVGLEVPARATWVRTLLGELNRVLSHLAFLGSAPVGPTGGSDRLLRDAWREREAVQSVLEEVAGGRMHFMFNRVGGLKEDLPAGWLGRVGRAVDGVRTRLGGLEDQILGDPHFVDRARGTAVLTPALVDAYGVSGPLARAAGVDLDLRRDEPYLAYGELLRAGVLRVCTRPEGDVLARFGVLLDQVAASLELVDACAARLASMPPGPVNVRLPKILRPPEGSVYAWTENPLGINGYYLVSRGEKTPWRMKLRTASFNNVAVLPELLAGCVVADLATVLGSLFFVVGDIDK